MVTTATPPTRSMRGAASSTYTAVCLLAAVVCLVGGLLVPGVVVLAGCALHRAAVRHQR